MNNKKGLISLLILFPLINPVDCDHCESTKQQRRKQLYRICMTSGRWSASLKRRRLGATTNSLTCEPPLIEAVVAKRPVLVKWLLEAGVDSQTRDSRGRSAQIWAFKLGYFDVLDLLMRANLSNIDKRLVGTYKTASGPSALMVATCNGRSGVVAALLKNGAEVGNMYNLGVQEDELFCAIRKRHPAAAMALLTHAKLPEGYFHHRDKTQLNEALSFVIQVWPTFLKVARKMLQLGASPVSANSVPLLVIAVGRKATTEVVNLILQYEPDVTRKGIGQVMPLHFACFNNLTDVAALLMKRGANVRAPDLDQDTPLHYCAMKDSSLKIAELLLENGAFVDARDNEGETPLTLAAHSGASMEILKFLLDNGANLNSANNNGLTALHQAAVKGDTKTVRFLLDRGANVNAADLQGKTALLAAVESNVSLEIVALLINRSSNVNQATDQGMTALMFAAVAGNKKVLDILLDNSANMNAKDGDGNTALMLGIANKCSLEIMAILLRRGGDASEVNENGETSLMIALKTYQLQHVEVLLNSAGLGSSANARDSRTKDSALILAIKAHVPVEIVEKLLENGADVHLRNKEGHAALSLVSSLKNDSYAGNISKALIRFGAEANKDRLDGLPKTASFLEQGGKALQRIADYPLKIVTTNTTATKRHNLAIFVQLFAVGGNGAFTEMCGGIGREFLQIINESDDILPGFSLEFHYRDVYWSSEDQNYLPRAFDHYVDPHFATDGTIRFPIVVGPEFDCPDPAKAIPVNLQRVMGMQRKLHNLSTLYISKCMQAEVTFRSTLDKDDVDSRSLAMLSLMGFVHSNKFGFAWKQVGIIADTRSESVVTQAALCLKWLTSNGIEVVDIQLGFDYRLIFPVVRQGRARILLIVDNYEQDNSPEAICFICYEMLCNAYWAGIRPDRYILLMKTTICSTSKCLLAFKNFENSYCSQEIQKKQLGMVFYAVQQTAARPLTSLSYKVSKFFEQIWDQSAKRKSLENRIRYIEMAGSADWRGFERVIKTTFYLLHAMALKFHKNEDSDTFQEILKQAVRGGNQSAVDYVQKLIMDTAVEAGIRPKNRRNEYEDQRTVLIVQPNFDMKRADSKNWQELAETRVVAKTWPMISEDRFNLNFSTYNVTPAQSIIWATQNSQPPKDLSRVIELNASYHSLAFRTILSFAGLTIIIHIVLAALAVKSTCSLKTREERKSEIYFDFGNNLLMLAACFTLDVSVVILLLSSEELEPSTSCMLKPFSSALGLSSVNGMLLARMVAMPRFVLENRYISRRYRNKSANQQFDKKVHEKQREAQLSRLAVKTTFGWMIFTVLVVLFLIIWILGDQMKPKWAVEHTDDPIFDTALDSLVTYRIEWCESANQHAWLAAFGILQAILLVSATFIGMALKHNIKFVRRRWKPEIVHIRMAITNALMVSVFVSLLMAIIPERPASIWYLKTLMFAVGLLMFSLSTSAIIFYRFWSPLLSPLEVIAKLKSSLTGSGIQSTGSSDSKLNSEWS